jgi:hypothetical protein
MTRFATATKLYHDGTENSGHALRRLVEMCQFGKGRREAFEVSHVAVAFVDVFDKCKCRD